METLILIAAAIIIIAIIVNRPKLRNRARLTTKTKPDYLYSRKPTVMSPAETSFYHRLEVVVADKYYIFPQMHLDSLLDHQVKGQSWKGALSKIQRKSVDYVLCDKQTMKPVYAIELDEKSHDDEERIARDQWVDKVFIDVGLPLVRFRNASSMTDDQIEQKFKNARH